jgi:hypothetical protein
MESPRCSRVGTQQAERVAHTTLLGLTNPITVAFADALLALAPPAV